MLKQSLKPAVESSSQGEQMFGFKPGALPSLPCVTKYSHIPFSGLRYWSTPVASSICAGTAACTIHAVAAVAERGGIDRLNLPWPYLFQHICYPAFDLLGHFAFKGRFDAVLIAANVSAWSMGVIRGHGKAALLF